MQQLAINFETSSKINKDKLKGQNFRLFQWLQKGNTIHVFHPAKKQLGIGYLNSRIADLRHKAGIDIYDRTIIVDNTHCKEYSLSPFL